MFFETTGDRDAAKFLRGAAGRARNPRAALLDVGEEMILDHQQRLRRGVDVDGRAFKRSRAAAQRGGQTLLDKGELANSVDYRATSSYLDAYSTDPRARTHNEGLLLRPKKGQFLTIPLRATMEESRQRFLGLVVRGNRTGARIRDYKDVFFRRSRGRLFAMQEIGKSGRIRALFLLVRSLQMTKRKWFGATERLRTYALERTARRIAVEKVEPRSKK
ncbi:MAG: phage virion morphogenesis protein [Thermoanaerobaculia bacterium]